jgi:hypothetical protein
MASRHATHSPPRLYRVSDVRAWHMFAQAMLKEGHRHLSGLDEAVIKNIEACKQLSKITRTSMGPNGTPPPIGTPLLSCSAAPGLRRLGNPMAVVSARVGTELAPRRRDAPGRRDA